MTNVATIIRMACSPGSRLSGSELGSGSRSGSVPATSGPRISLEQLALEATESDQVNRDA